MSLLPVCRSVPRSTSSRLRRTTQIPPTLRSLPVVMIIPISSARTMAVRPGRKSSPAFLTLALPAPFVKIRCARDCSSRAPNLASMLSFDSGDHWQSLQLNLPVASVRDLTIHGADLVAATFGRGLWILDDISPLRQVSPTSPARPFASLCLLRRFARVGTTIPTRRYSPERPWRRIRPMARFCTIFSTRHPKGEITLDVLDSQGTRVAHFSNVPAKESALPANVPELWFYPPAALPISAGINRFVWDLRYPHPVALPYGYFGERLAYTEYSLPDHAVPRSDSAIPAAGSLWWLPVNMIWFLPWTGKTYRQKLDVLPDPRVSMSRRGLFRSTESLARLCDWMDSSAKSLTMLRWFNASWTNAKNPSRRLLPKE